MRELIKSFPLQLKNSITSGKIHGDVNKEKTISSIVVCGMGGSGIGGKIVSEWIRKELKARSQFGQSTVQLCRILNSYGIIDNSIFNKLELAAQKLEVNQDEIEKDALGFATQLSNSIPIIYSSSDYEGVAIRWRQQIGENSKMLCWHHQFPEMNHNELVGWEGSDNRFSAIMLQNEDDAERVKVRMEVCKEIFKEKGTQVVEIDSWGENAIEKSLYLVHLGDWISLHLAEINGTDPVDIKNIDFLKNKLEKI